MAYSIPAKRTVLAENDDMPTEGATEKMDTIRKAAASSSASAAADAGLHLAVLPSILQGFAQRPGMTRTPSTEEKMEINGFMASLRSAVSDLSSTTQLTQRDAVELLSRVFSQAWAQRRDPSDILGRVKQFNDALGDAAYDPRDLTLEDLDDPEGRAARILEWNRSLRAVAPELFDRKGNPVNRAAARWTSDMIEYDIPEEAAGVALHTARTLMEPTADGIVDWPEVQFLSQDSRDMLTYALSTQAAIALRDYAQAESRNESAALAVSASWASRAASAARAAIGCARRIEQYAAFSPPETEKDYAFTACTAMREGMKGWHDYTRRLYDAIPKGKSPDEQKRYAVGPESIAALDKVRERRDFVLSAMSSPEAASRHSHAILMRQALFEGYLPLWVRPDGHPMVRAMLGSMSVRGAIIETEAAILALSQKLSTYSNTMPEQVARSLWEKMFRGVALETLKSERASIAQTIQKDGINPADYKGPTLIMQTERAIRVAALWSLSVLGQPGAEDVKAWSISRVERATQDTRAESESVVTQKTQAPV